jgi:hypothetical protein
VNAFFEILGYIIAPGRSESALVMRFTILQIAQL